MEDAAHAAVDDVEQHAGRLESGRGRASSPLPAEVYGELGVHGSAAPQRERRGRGQTLEKSREL